MLRALNSAPRRPDCNKWLTVRNVFGKAAVHSIRPVASNTAYYRQGRTSARSKHYIPVSELLFPRYRISANHGATTGHLEIQMVI